MLQKRSVQKKLFLSLYFDEDVSVVIVKIFQAHGFDAICASQMKMFGKTDEQQLAYASSKGRVFITHNKEHFLKLHKDYLAMGRHHSGIVLMARRRDNYEVARRLLQFLNKIPFGGLDNQIGYI